MAVEIQPLVEIHIKPVLAIDATLQGDLPTLITAQIALQGYADEASMAESDRVLVAALTLESLLPRLALIYNDEVQENREGLQQTKLPDRARFFANLQKAIAAMKQTAARSSGTTIGDDTAVAPKAWPGVGLMRW